MGEYSEDLAREQDTEVKHNANEIIVKDVKEFLELTQNIFSVSLDTLTTFLQCDRQWVLKYVKPNVHYLRAPSFKKDTIFHYANCSKEAQKLNKSIWFNTEEVKNLIKENLVCYRKTIRVPLNLFIPVKYAESIWHILYFQNSKTKTDYAKKCEIIKFINNYKHRILKVTKLEDVSQDFEIQPDMLIYFLNDGYEITESAELEESMSVIQDFKIQLSILDNFPRYQDRAKVNEVEEELPAFEKLRLQRLRDFINEFPNRETAYRKLFTDGYSRIELTLKTADGSEKSTLTYCLKRDYLSHYSLSYFLDTFNYNDTILIRYQDWLKYKDELLRMAKRHDKIFAFDPESMPVPEYEDDEIVIQDDQMLSFKTFSEVQAMDSKYLQLEKINKLYAQANQRYIARNTVRKDDNHRTIEEQFEKAIAEGRANSNGYKDITIQELFDAFNASKVE